jgi:hypothetical protein
MDRYLHIMNLFSFKHFNTMYHDIDITKTFDKSLPLWSISKWSFTQYKGLASYHYYTQNYEFNGKRYSSYNDLMMHVIYNCSHSFAKK